MTQPSPTPVPGPPAAAADPLVEVERALDALADLPLEAHPELFATVDRQLRAALDAAGTPGRG